MAEQKASARKPRKATAPKPEAEPAEVDEQSPVTPEPHPTGFVGALPDDTPNEHYSLSGVLSGKPVPGHNR